MTEPKSSYPNGDSGVGSTVDAKGDYGNIGGNIGRGRRVTVVGAGFSGLTSALYLSRAGFDVDVVEASRHGGGLIGSHDEPFGLVEMAANGLLSSVDVEELFEFVGARLLPTKREARRRFVFREGRARRWPLGISATLRMIRFVLGALFRPRNVGPRAGETVRSWGRRVMGEEASNYTIETFLQGIYAGDAGRMSASLIFGRFFRRSGDRSARKAKDPALEGRRQQHRGTVSAIGGMGELIACLQKALEARGVPIHHGKELRLKEKPRHPIVVATSAQAAGQVIEGLDAARGARLQQVELLPLVTTTIAFERGLPIEGFGCLFPPSEQRRALGVLLNTFIFEGRARRGYSETWILGGALLERRTPGLLEMSDEQILALIDEEREAAFGARSPRLGYRITRWPRAIPHYTVELERILHEADCRDLGVFFTGNWLGQIGLAKILERSKALSAEIDERGVWS